MNSDLTFFTNEPGASLLDRFKTILKHVQYFDVLVGYFRTSGFHQIYEALEDIDKIRILVGLKIDPKAYEIIEEARAQRQTDFESHSKTNASILKGCRSMTRLNTVLSRATLSGAHRILRLSYVNPTYILRTAPGPRRPAEAALFAPLPFGSWPLPAALSDQRLHRATGG
jgi:hypothetical protein